MARIDGLLRLVIQQGADELRLLVEREPKMFARGAPKRLSVPATSEETLRILLGDILSAERDQELNANGRAETTYEAAGLGVFQVKFKLATTGGFEVTFLHAEVHGGATTEPEPGPEPGPIADTAEPISRKRTIPMVSALPPAASDPPPAAARATTPPSAAARVQTAPAHAPPTATAHAPPTAAAHAPPTAAAHAPPTAAAHAPPTAAATPATKRATLPERNAAASGSMALIELIRHATALGASDVHLAEGELPRVRVDGQLSTLSETVCHELPKLLGLEDHEHQHVLRGGSSDLALELPKLGRMRVHVYRTDSGMAAALRLMPRAAPSISELNMPVAFDDLVDLPHGLVLVCGAAGAGKSTTLAALAQELLRRRSVVMVTLEDPIEYTLTPGAHSLVRRRQIGRDVRDFPAGLRDALRADPEVLLVGEMRDSESISLALTAAETGHLVLSSLHSGSATSAIERIVDAYPTAHKEQIRTQLADALRAVIVQRLLPRARNAGRIPAVEVLRVTRAVASLIRDGKTEQLPTVLQSSKRDGMLALERSLADRVQSGEVLLSAASAAANDPDVLLTYLGTNKSKVM
ncbi:MAG TPA: PilT/PilU family type 4a pilus ATPase [Polyangiales bacterium]|nr:PilT/PilU family type 4a pilus ATPase [Polyangiales bacterium]